jgi:hypothetical protein
MSKRKSIALLLVIALLSTQFACEAGTRLLIFLNSENGFERAECDKDGGEWVYDQEDGEWYCDYSNVEPAPEPPLWNEPEQPAPEEAPPSAPEAHETLEPEECNQRAAVDIRMGPNDNTVCGCAYFVHFTSYEETILYYRTQTYRNADDPTQRWQVQRLYAGETWTWSSETIEDGICVPAVIDEYTIFIAVEGCDNMYKRASWAIDEYAQPLTGLCP